MSQVRDKNVIDLEKGSKINDNGSRNLKKKKKFVTKKTLLNTSLIHIVYIRSKSYPKNQYQHSWIHQQEIYNT